jgi:putative transposase
MPRQPRLLLNHSYYHIMTRGNNRHDVFKDHDDYIYFLDLVSRFKAEHPFELYHYCLMTNHVHLLVRTNMASDFSNFMKRLNLAYFHHYRNTYGWVGHFWQDRFKSQPVGKDNYFIQCGKYIELNPVRAGIVDKPDKYEYSSYGYYAEGRNNPLITEDSFYNGLGKTKTERQSSYADLVIGDLINDTFSKSVWGSDYQRYQETRKTKQGLDKKRKKRA